MKPLPPLDHSRGNTDRPRGARETAPLHEDPEKSVWHVHNVNAAHHVSFVPFWMGTSRQKAFWRDLGSWLYAIDAKRSVTQP